MAKFRFNLEPLLKARAMAERSCQHAVAKIERERIDMEDALRRHQMNISQGKQTLRDGLTGSVNVRDLRMHAGAAMQVMRKAQRTVLELAGVHRRLETARDELVESAKRRRAVELVREQRFAAWKAGLDKAEAAAIDELAVIAAARKESVL
jgi:flagellar protein FliJ